MRKIFPVLAIVGAAAIILASRPSAAESKPAKEAFICKLSFSETDMIGKRTTVSEPTLTTEDGAEASFLAGGFAKIDLGTPDETLPFGTGATVKIHRVTQDKVRVSFNASHCILDYPSASTLGIHEVATRIVTEVALGEAITIDLDGGRRVTATVTAAK